MLQCSKWRFINTFLIRHKCIYLSYVCQQDLDTQPILAFNPGEPMGSYLAAVNCCSRLQRKYISWFSLTVSSLRWPSLRNYWQRESTTIVRKKNVSKCNLIMDKDPSKKDHGSYDYQIESNTNTVWNDTKAVSLTSTYVGPEPLGEARRWDKSKKRVYQHWSVEYQGAQHFHGRSWHAGCASCTL